MMMSLSLTLSRAQEPPPGKTKAKPAEQPAAAKAKTGEPAKEKKETAKRSTDEEPVVTHHRMRLGGAELKYTATAGLMPIRDDKGEIEARIFFIAYTRDDAGPTESRPLLFSFNGGPGSASVWLHLGALGPRRVAAARRADDPGAAVPAGRQRRHLARPRRPGLHRPGGHRLLPRRQARARTPSSTRSAATSTVGRRVHPDVPDAVRPMVVAAVPDRRELRHDPRRRAGRAPGRPRHRVQRRDPGLLRARLPGVRLHARATTCRS